MTSQNFLCIGYFEIHNPQNLKLDGNETKERFLCNLCAFQEEEIRIKNEIEQTELCREQRPLLLSFGLSSAVFKPEGKTSIRLSETYRYLIVIRT